MKSLRSLLVPLVLLGAVGCDDDTAAVDAAPADSGVCMVDASHCLIIDDAGVSHGCAQGGMGPGDRDDGGGAPLVSPPDAGGATNLPYGAECDSNDQCSTNICFFYKVKGYFCTTFCACDSDCPPPSLGCGGQGVCRMGN
jgi:hypothetical protein